MTLDFLGEDTLDVAQADATVRGLPRPPRASSPRRGLAAQAEVRGQALRHRPGAAATTAHKIALENARTICRAARNAGTTVTLDMEDHTTTDSTLATLRELRKDFPETGAVLQAYLHRTEADCRALAYEGSRVRLCKGAYNEPEEVAFQDRLDVDKSYVRCLKVLLAGQGYPMIATHDPRMVADRLVAGQPLRPRARAPTSSRCSTASAPRSRSGWPRPARRCGSTSPTAGVVRLPDATARRAPAEPDILPAVLISKK